MKNKTLISVVGTTGIGKTKLAIDLARQFNTEIISCDSRQFFSEMKIGTAAPSEDELSQAKHHFIGQLSVKDYYSIGQFEHDSLELLDQLFERYDIIIMVGGSMMYEKAVIEGLNDLPEANEKNQKKLETIWKTEGIEKLQEMLKDLDPEYYENVDIHNQRRLLRAIDVIWQTEKKYSENIAHPKNPRNFKTIRIGIEAPRETIYERINLRVDKMMENGLLNEAKNLDELRKSQEGRNLASLNTVGYSELFKYFDEEWDLDFAVSEIKKNSRRFAKRQLTWYRKEENIHYIEAGYSKEDFDSLVDYIESEI
ncbi:tRNA dimethylallyltransferase [Chryseobacterium aquaeductus]|uniref:tRNA dimethylallyltransferase n=1 Tax=Chryseobacterium aquaeductus TaxID=2675056 RepID=A0A9N8MHS8_9FLAO|nr:tRNA (adenosine(37)-N6)-dimethylallyltransferase MiaA [Chryseobacterium aquaeductus]CAA7331442.1 tRNA dimethylallyltransferase [Chryseobacterium potabilaquae]CAD7810229.1 tRNA dimethylallyltransferase [Chryseobacterium aquaeductus]